MLESAGTDLMQLPLTERRRRLEDVLHDLHPCLQLILQTRDPELASEWLGEVPGLEGVVAKRADGRYRPGRRDWIKVKPRRTADCVVVGIAGDESAPKLVLALRHLDGELRLLGRIGLSCVIYASRRGSLNGQLRGAGVAQDVDDVAIGVADEEAAYAPRLVRYRVDDLRSGSDGGRVTRVYIVDLDRELGDARRGFVVSHQTDLAARALGVGQSDDPAMVHDRLQAKNVAIEGPRLS
jgi:hypothetical protein